MPIASITCSFLCEEKKKSTAIEQNKTVTQRLASLEFHLIIKWFSSRSQSIFNYSRNQLNQVETILSLSRSYRSKHQNIFFNNNIGEVVSFSKIWP